MARLNRIKVAAFDLDGTIYYGNQIIEGAARVIDFLKENGIQVRYFTNNSSKTRNELFAKLKKMGLELSPEEVYNSAYATAVFIQEKKIKNIYCVGTSGLAAELKEHGAHLTDKEEEVEAIVVGLDPCFNYQKLAKCLAILQKRSCKLIACNRDQNYPVENGKLLPGSGPIVAAIEKVFNVSVDYLVGKPDTFMLELLSKDGNFKNNDILVMGDSYGSDIEMAKRYGSPSILISNTPLEGATTVKNLGEIKQLLAKTLQGK